MADKVTLKVDDVVYILLALGAQYNSENAGEKQRKKVRRRMDMFCLKHLILAKAASDKAQSMTPDELTEFYQNYKLNEKFKKEVEVI